MPFSSKTSIFISYARPDAKHVAQSIYEYYHERLQGYNVFLDTEKIEGGKDWEETIRDKVNKSDIVLALITEGVFKSKYISEEIRYAIKNKKYVIPCVRQNVDVNKLKRLGFEKEQIIF